MRRIDSYIIEKLHLNKDISIKSDVYEKICKILQVEANHNLGQDVKKWLTDNNIKDVDVYCDKQYAEKYFEENPSLKELVEILSDEDSNDYAKKYKGGNSLFDNGHVFMYTGEDYLSVYRRFGNLYFIAA